MLHWSLALLGLSTAAGAQAPAAGDPFCGELGRLIAAAAEAPPFASLPVLDGRRAAAMLGFPDGCGRLASGEPAFVCHRQLPPEKLRVDTLAAKIARCLPAAERLPDPAPEGLFREHIVRFRIPGLTIEAAEGGWRTAGGGVVELTIRPADEQGLTHIPSPSMGEGWNGVNASAAQARSVPRRRPGPRTASPLDPGLRGTKAEIAPSNKTPLAQAAPHPK